MATNFKRKISRYLDIQQSDLQKYVRAGETDGARDYPDKSQKEFGSTELGYATEADAAWRKYISSFNEEVEELDKKIEGARRQIEDEIVTDIDNLNSELQEHADQLDREMGRDSAKYQLLQNELDLATGDLTSVKAMVNRPLETKFIPYYIPFLTLLTFSEVPVNRLAFQLVFEATPIVALVLSFVIGLIFIFFAHNIGTGAKRTLCKEVQPPTAKIYAALTGLVALAGILMFVLALMRQMWTSVQTTQTDFSVLLEEDLSGAVGQVFGVELGQEGYLLLLVNLAIFVSGCVAAFIRHDSHPTYEIGEQKYKKTERNIFQHKQLLEQKQNSLDKSFNRKIAASRNKQRDVSRYRDELLQEKTEAQKIRTQDHAALLGAVGRIIISYQKGNSEKRTSSPPSYFTIDNKQIISELIKYD